MSCPEFPFADHETQNHSLRLALGLDGAGLQPHLSDRPGAGLRLLPLRAGLRVPAAGTLAGLDFHSLGVGGRILVKQDSLGAVNGQSTRWEVFFWIAVEGRSQGP